MKREPKRLVRGAIYGADVVRVLVRLWVMFDCPSGQAEADLAQDDPPVVGEGTAVVIAEITPSNPNVYYEVGYADALNKPLILIADRKEGLKPLDVRGYRTIFFEDSIGGKNKIENDFRPI